VVRRRPERPGSEILRDEVVLLQRIQEAGPVALMRRIEIWVEDRQETIILLTNHLWLAASTVAAVYRERWQVQQFFRALKQSLRIKTLAGTSANAVLVQI
jgi:IS4 transposase